mgnify:CR=1 FL=1
MPSLIEALRDINYQRPNQCGTCHWYEQLAPEEQDSLSDAIQRAVAGEIPYAAIHRVCRAHGLRVSDDAFRDHCRNHHEKRTNR